MIQELVEKYMDHLERGKSKGGVWSEEYMDHGFTKSIKELDGCCTMLKELRFVIEGRRIDVVPLKVTPQLPKLEVKAEEKILKAEDFNCELNMDFECIYDLNVHDLDYGLNLKTIIKNQIKFSMANKKAISITIENFRVVDTEHTTRCFGSWIDRWYYGRRVNRYEGFRVDVKRKSIKDKVRRAAFEVDETLDIKNSRASSFQVRGFMLTKLRNTTLLVTISNEVVGFNSIKELYASNEDFSKIWMELETKQHRDEFLLLDSYLFKGNRLYIPKTFLRTQLIKEIHVGGFSAHLGRDRTIASVESRFYQSQLKRDVGAFVEGCVVCQEEKVKAQNTGLYMLLLIPERPWVDISKDIVLGLPRTQWGVDYVFVLVDSLPKMAHFIPCKKFSDAAHIARLRLSTSLNFSSTAHPQTDGQSEEVSRTLGNMIRCLYGKKPKLWDVSLAQAEFAYNSSVHSFTGFSPFEVVYKTSPRHMVDLIDLPGKKNIQANRMVEEFQATHEVVRANITKANAKYKIAADKHRRKKLFQVGDKINDNAYVVDLPSTMSISKTFNVSDIYEFHSEDVNEAKHSRTSFSKEKGNDEDMIQELAKEYMNHLEHCKSKGIARSNVTPKYKYYMTKQYLESSHYFKDDSLSFCCMVRVDQSCIRTKKFTIIPPPPEMEKDFKYLLDSEIAQFYGLVGNPALDEVELMDIEPSVFKAMLLFIYSDKLPDSQESVGSMSHKIQHLLVAADRFGLDRLKKLCEAKLYEELNVDAVATTLSLAHDHHCSQLKTICMDFAVANLRVVVQTEGYKYIEKSCPLLLSELLQKIASEN
nr:BTB/POZ/MATH-domains containing protein [Tanacetum cinerariifolium]